jgi:hypothetical protein
MSWEDCMQILKQIILAYFQALPRNSPGENEVNNENTQPRELETLPGFKPGTSGIKDRNVPKIRTGFLRNISALPLH